MINLAGGLMINFVRGTVLSCVLVAAALSGAEAQQSLSIEQVKDGLYAIVGSGGNVGVRVTSDGVILIDDKYPRNFDEIQDLVAQVSDLPVKYVLNTHHHGDHAGTTWSVAIRTHLHEWFLPIRPPCISVASRFGRSTWAVDTPTVTP
jgi:glyoxylase-like metal-dependent hydrolase (beta-lactamase superfamily II)